MCAAEGFDDVSEGAAGGDDGNDGDDSDGYYTTTWNRGSYLMLIYIYTRVQTNTYYIANLTITLILLCKRGHASVTHVPRIETAAADDDGLAEGRTYIPLRQRDYRDLPRFKIASYIIIKSYTKAGHTSYGLYNIIIVCSVMGMINDEHRHTVHHQTEVVYSLIFTPRVFKIGKT